MAIKLRSLTPGRLVNKVREVQREDGTLGLISSVLRFLYGNIHLVYLRRIKSADSVVVNMSGQKLKVFVDDPGIGSELIQRGCHEKLATRRVQRTMKPGMVVIDLGANIGYYATMEGLRVRPGGKVYAIEPEPKNVALLKENVAKNHLEETVECFQMAIGNECGTAELNISNASSRHTVGMIAPDNANVGAIEVKMLTVDKFIEERGIDPSSVNFVRMDVEGYEAKVFLGMKKLFEVATDLAMFIEFHPSRINDIPDCSFAGCLDLLESAGFRFTSVMWRDKIGKLVLKDVPFDDIRNNEEMMTTTVLETWLHKG